MDIVIRKAQISDADKLFKLVCDFATSFKTERAAFEECLRNLSSDEEEWSKSRNSKLIALATRRAESFYKALGYEESAIYFRKLL